MSDELSTEATDRTWIYQVQIGLGCMIASLVLALIEVVAAEIVETPYISVLLLAALLFAFRGILGTTSPLIPSSVATPPFLVAVRFVCIACQVLSTILAMAIVDSTPTWTTWVLVLLGLNWLFGVFYVGLLWRITKHVGARIIALQCLSFVIISSLVFLLGLIAGSMSLSAGVDPFAVSSDAESASGPLLIGLTILFFFSTLILIAWSAAILVMTYLRLSRLPISLLKSKLPEETVD